MDKVQLIFFFLGGFIISRLIIKVRIPERLVYFFISERHISLAAITFYLIALSALLSFFIPNAITVLTLLPMLELLRRAFSDEHSRDRRIPTVLALSTIYGANIGGMGSITATPANGILATFTELNHIPGTEKLTFASWLIWGIPLVLLMVLAAWLVLVFFFRLWQEAGNRVHLPFHRQTAHHPRQGFAAIITLFYFFSSLLLSAAMMEFPGYKTPILIITALVTLAFVGFLFLVPLALPGVSAEKKVLLTIPDCYSNLPMRGFGFVALAIVLAGVLYLFRVDSWIAGMAQTLLPDTFSLTQLFIITALITSFATELLSNTAVQLSFFVILVPLADSLHFPAMLGLIVVTLSSTCAFMSPIATGVNGLAFGGVKHVSFPRMMLAGFFMNLAGAVIISLWVKWVAAWVIGL